MITVAAQTRQESYIENYDCAITCCVPQQTNKECAEYRDAATIEEYDLYNRVAVRKQTRRAEVLGLSFDIYRSETNAVHQEYNEKAQTAKEVAITLIAGAQARYAAYQTSEIALTCLTLPTASR